MSYKFNAIEGRFDLVEPMKVGGSIIGGDPDSILYIDSSGNLAQLNPGFTFDGTDMNLGDDMKLMFGDATSSDSYIEWKTGSVHGYDYVNFYSSERFIFEGVTEAIIQGKLGDPDGQDILLLGGDAYIDGGGGDVYIYGGGDGGGDAPEGNVYLGNTGASERGEVWFLDSTGIHLGDEDNNSAKIYHDGDDLVIDSRWTGDGGTLLFPTGMEIEGDINFDQVDEMSLAEAQAIVLTENLATGTLAAGEYHYDFYFITNEGDTSTINKVYGTTTVPDITISANSAITITNIPISADRKVTARGIMRTEANQVGFVAKLVHTINDNTTTTYQDTGLPAGSGESNFRKPNTTAGTISVEDIPFMRLNDVNLFIGENAGVNNVDYDNVVLGNSAFDASTTSQDSTIVGTEAGTDVTTGGVNTFFGRNAGRNITTGASNTIVGGYAYPNSAGANINNTTVIGKDAIFNGPSANHHDTTAVGYRAGRNWGGGRNIFLGAYAGDLSSRQTPMYDNIVIGYQAGRSFTGGAGNNLMIGYQVEPDVANGDWQMNINNLIKGDRTSGSEYLWYPLDELFYFGLAKDAYIGFDGNSLNIVANGVTATDSLEITADHTKTTGGRVVDVTRLTSNTTLDSTHHNVFCDTDGGDFTVTLPAGSSGTIYRIINCGSSGNDVTITPNGAELLTGTNASRTLSDGSVIILVYETTEGWW